MERKFKLGESVIYLYGDGIKKGEVVVYKEELLDGGLIDVSYRVKSEDGNVYYKKQYELGRTEMELANNLLESYGFSEELRFRPVCERCTRSITESD